MSLTTRLLIAASLLGVAAGCSSSGGGSPTPPPPEPDASDSCAFARDGTCDEPGNCALGTDSTDCVAACASEGPHYLFAAACAHRSPVTGPAYADPQPSGGAGQPTGNIEGTIPVPSGEDASVTVARDYRLFVPASYDPGKAWPLVINMGGHRVDHRDLASATMLMRSADLNGFLLVFAAQEFRGGRFAWWTDWDWENAKARNPDFLFLRKLIDRVAGQYNVDRRRIILSGHSRGAAMSFIAAMEMPDLIAGAAVESGFTEFGYLDTLPATVARKVPLVFVHGQQDEDVCIDCRPGGTCWVNGRGCSPGLHATDAIVEKLHALGWKDGQDLVYYRLKHVTHRWQDQLNQQWWDFLSARPLPQE